MKERDELLAVATALRNLVTVGEMVPSVPGKCLVDKQRLLTMAATIERMLLANAFEQPPSLREWRLLIDRQATCARCKDKWYNGSGGDPVHHCKVLP